MFSRPSPDFVPDFLYSVVNLAFSSPAPKISIIPLSFQFTQCELSYISGDEYIISCFENFDFFYLYIHRFLGETDVDKLRLKAI